MRQREQSGRYAKAERSPPTPRPGLRHIVLRLAGERDPLDREQNRKQGAYTLLLREGCRQQDRGPDQVQPCCGDPRRPTAQHARQNDHRTGRCQVEDGREKRQRSGRKPENRAASRQQDRIDGRIESASFDAHIGVGNDQAPALEQVLREHHVVARIPQRDPAICDDHHGNPQRNHQGRHGRERNGRRRVAEQHQRHDRRCDPDHPHHEGESRHMPIFPKAREREQAIPGKHQQWHDDREARHPQIDRWRQKAHDRGLPARC